ncbi:MAG: hypothetical protein WD062_06470 [Chloroflexota bacterium]
MAHVTAGRLSAIWLTAALVAAFGLAMGYLEATVVVYLRAALDIVPGAIPAHDAATFGTFEAIEIARELATLVMIAAVGWLAGRSPLERLAWTAVVFGTWDVAYYLGLRLTVGWPPSLAAWDVLFLVPMPWVGPVWAPILASTGLVGFGLVAADRLRAGRPIAVSPWRVLGALAGGGLVIASFLADAERVLAGGGGAWSSWPLFAAGMALASAAIVTALVGGFSPRRRPIVDPGT